MGALYQNFTAIVVSKKLNIKFENILICGYKFCPFAPLGGTEGYPYLFKIATPI